MTRRPLAAVIGGAHAPPEILEAAERLGELLVDARFRVLTGGLGGVMEATSRGARASKAWVDGDVIGVLPGLVSASANPFVDVAIVTGMNHARNVVVVASADVVVAVGGGAGTLSELALAWQHRKPIIGLAIGEGWSARLAGEVLDDRHAEPIHRAQDPEEAVRLARALVMGEKRAPHYGF